MRLSKLQKYILTKCYQAKGGQEQKSVFFKFYGEKELKKNKLAIQVAMQKSLDNLVKKDLAVSFGHQTAQKWYIDKVKLTIRGRKTAIKLIRNRQKKLPIK